MNNLQTNANEWNRAKSSLQAHQRACRYSLKQLSSFAHAYNVASNRTCMVLWKCCHKHDCLPSKGWGVWQPYITSRAAAAPLFWTPSVERRQRCCRAEPPGLQVTLGRRAAAWFTRSTTDCKAFPTSSDIATFHIPSNVYDIERKETCLWWRQSAFKIKVLLRKCTDETAPSIDPVAVF